MYIESERGVEGEIEKWRWRVLPKLVGERGWFCKKEGSGTGVMKGEEAPLEGCLPAIRVRVKTHKRRGLGEEGIRGWHRQ